MSAEFNTFVNGSLSFLRIPVVSNLLTLLLVSYAGMAAPALPGQFKDLLKHAAVRVAVLFLVVWTNNRDPTVALAIALGLVVGMNLLSGRTAFETFLIEQNSNVIPSCQGLTMADVLASFGGDQERMVQALHNTAFPHSVELNDYNAPIVASHLVNRGHVIDSCHQTMGNQ